MNRHAALFILLAGILPAGAPTAAAQDAAPKLVRIVVPFSPGASNDAIARTIAGPLAKRLDTSVIVENKPGASGIIGSDAVAKSPRDGSVLLLTSSTFLTAAATQARLPFDPLNSFAAIGTVGQNPSLLAVSSATPFKSANDLLAAARAAPGNLTYGTAGVGSIGHLVTEMFSAAAKIRMRHVPYKGAAIAAIDLAGGQIQVMVSSFSTLSPFLKADKVRLEDQNVVIAGSLERLSDSVTRTRLAGEAAQAARALQSVLDQYADARPAELRQERVTAKQAKRAEKQKRKQ